MALRYDIAYGLAAAAASPVLGYRLLRTGKWRTDWRGRLGHGGAVGNGSFDDRPRVLIHAVSVGEVNAVRQLVHQLAVLDAPPHLVIAVTTDTGYARARELFADRFPVVRYPLDLSGAVKRFLDRVRPDLVALTELEVWPNFLDHCTQRGVDVCVINGRLSERSYNRYRRFAPLLRSTFGRLSAAAVQAPMYASRFEALGTPIDRIRVLDTMKWDTATLRDDVPGSDELARAMGIDRTKPVIVAGSTGEGEEKLLLDQLAHWPADAQLVLVPRKPERFASVAEVAAGYGTVVRRSEHGDGVAGEEAGIVPGAADGGTPLASGVEGREQIFLVDTMGELGQAYALADVAVVGRSFNGWGGSDPIEPVALGKATVIGPDHGNFVDVVAALQSGGGIRITRDPGAEVAELLANPSAAGKLAEAGRSVIRQRQGSTARHVALIQELLAARRKK